MMRSDIHGKESMESGKHGIRGLLGKYGSYGFDEFWLDQLWRYRDNVWTESFLGPAEKKSMKVWLKDAELVDSKGKPTQLFSSLYDEGYYANRTGASIVWVNLCYNSALFRWAAFAVPQLEMGRDEIVEAMGEEVPLQQRKILARLLFQSVEQFFGKNLPFVAVEGEGRRAKLQWRLCPAEDIDYIAFLYALYRYAEAQGYYAFTLSQLMQDLFAQKTLTDIAQTMETPIGLSPLRMFPMTMSEVKRLLRGLHTSFSKFIIVELVYDLDNIYLNPDKSSLDVVEFINFMRRGKAWKE